jgi:hypothetical protein
LAKASASSGLAKQNTTKSLIAAQGEPYTQEFVGRERGVPTSLALGDDMGVGACRSSRRCHSGSGFRHRGRDGIARRIKPPRVLRLPVL